MLTTMNVCRTSTERPSRAQSNFSRLNVRKVPLALRIYSHGHTLARWSQHGRWSCQLPAEQHINMSVKALSHISGERMLARDADNLITERVARHTFHTKAGRQV